MGRIVAGIEVPTIVDADARNARRTLYARYCEAGPKSGAPNRLATADDYEFAAASKVASERFDLWMPTAKPGFKRLCRGLKVSPLCADLGAGHLESVTGYDHDTLQRNATWNVFLCSLTCAAELLRQAWMRELSPKDKDPYGLCADVAEGDRWKVGWERAADRIAFVFAMLKHDAEKEADRRQRVELASYAKAARLCEGAAILAGLADADLDCALAMLRGVSGTHGAGNVGATAFSSTLARWAEERAAYDDACKEYEYRLNEYFRALYEDSDEYGGEEIGPCEAVEPVKPTFEGAKAVSELRRELDRLLDDAISPPQTG